MVNIRVMSITDYDGVYNLWINTPGMGLNSIDDSREGIEKFLQRNPTTSFVAECDDKIIGVIMAGHDGRRGYIYHTAVLPAYRNQGIAKRLVGCTISALEQFDVIISSLAFHYVEDFEGVVRDVYNLLDENGIFIFSQENPLCTCHSGGNRWTRDENGNKLYLNLANYGVEGERESVWFVDNVKKYHRTFSTIVNTLIEAGFAIEKMIEPLPTDELLEKYPDYADLFHKPDFLLIKEKSNMLHEVKRDDYS